jgi:hypothetical protein
MLNSGEVIVGGGRSDMDMANRINNYNHVESTVIKRD